MKTFLALLTFGALLSAGEYSKSDRETLLGKLRESRGGVAAIVSGMSVEHSNFKLANEVWSVTQVVEHLALIEDLLFGLLTNTVENSKPVPDDQPLADPAELDRRVYEGVSDRTNKAKAPEQAVPKGEYANWEDALKAFGERRGKTIQFVQNFKGDLRRYFIESPLGKLDGHQWLLLLAAHTERHGKQISELKAHENFPKTE